ncbi:unnamed protein product, partial [Symbiodinium microadriaticum]
MSTRIAMHDKSRLETQLEWEDDDDDYPFSGAIEAEILDEDMQRIINSVWKVNVAYDSCCCDKKCAEPVVQSGCDRQIGTAGDCEGGSSTRIEVHNESRLEAQLEWEDDDGDEASDEAIEAEM